MHGGVKFYRGAAKAARAYVERDRSRADDYYLTEGSGVAEHLAATPAGVEHAGSMNGETYERWVAGTDVETGAKKGRIRDDDDSIALIGQELTLPDTSDGPTGPVVISLPVTRCTPATVDKLAEILKSHPGMTEVQVRLKAPNKTTIMRIGNEFRVTSSQPLMADLKAELGPSCLAG